MALTFASYAVPGPWWARRAVAVAAVVDLAALNSSAPPDLAPRRDRRWPRPLNLLGAAGCLVLVATLPWQSILAGVAMFAVGLIGRRFVLRHRAPTPLRPG
ncbi:hypothetical protein [Actinomadura fibrosa]|uniref:Uncharacterized protein n=1 Tax=Actinomadura fibrosa TaxID=111802 RepID=A0ABW2XSG9_9ACTN|nr:hypothetical protein [Actinomadura fibrosa]